MKSELMCLLQRNPCVYYGFIGRNNLGDEAIWHATRILFKEINLHAIKQTRFNLINSLLGNKDKHLTVLGGGTLIGDNKSDGTNPFREQFVWLSKTAGHKIVFGTGVGAIDINGNTPSWLLDWKSLLSDCEYIGVRGEQSKKVLQTIGIESEVIGDSACALALPHRNPVQKKVIGVNVGARTDLLPKEGVATYAEFIGSKYDAGWQVEFYVINPADYALTKNFIHQCGIDHPVIISVYNDTEKYLHRVRETHCFIGTRLHSVILASCAGVPSIMLGYASKSYDFMESIGMEKFNIFISELTIEKLERAFDDLLTDTTGLSNDILSRLVFYKDIQEYKAKQIISNL
ncbi:polysaccharide pyruvyl transferase family protein [Methylobacter marinus]|uniref:polysaccharide pyruvyl transferase family protein n=1 Tax=Methylobacter marinus TaxID=34058 RepID=UPI0003650169|nr:polysaccharide pyruvyl transferase family protein [Methylobacter marinus]